MHALALAHAHAMYVHPSIHTMYVAYVLRFALRGGNVSSSDIIFFDSFALLNSHAHSLTYLLTHLLTKERERERERGVCVCVCVCEW